MGRKVERKDSLASNSEPRAEMNFRKVSRPGRCRGNTAEIYFDLNNGTTPSREMVIERFVELNLLTAFAAFFLLWVWFSMVERKFG